MVGAGVGDRELAAFGGYLDTEREHILGILDGLGEEQLRQPVLPSGWNCLELVRHLTVDVERFWFRGVVAAEPEIVAGMTAGLTAHWSVPEGMGAAEVLAEYRAEIERSDLALAALGRSASTEERLLDREPAAWPTGIWPSWRLPDLRSVLLHLLTELSCHAGHLDAARELIDGKAWLPQDPFAA